MTARIAPVARVALAVALFGSCTLAASSADVVILKDGFIIQGDVRKETETIYDKATGRPIRITKATGLDIIDEGPKYTIFSTHSKQLGAINPNTKLRPEVKSFTMKALGQPTHALPAIGETIKTTEFNDRWIREIHIKVPGTSAPEVVKQQITYLDPYYIYLFSYTHRWRQSYRTSEWDPRLVRKLLMKHPEIAEPDGKCDPLKRVMLAKFMLDAGWLQFAKDEVDRLKRDFTGEMSKEAKEQYEKLLKEIDQATAELVVREAELALAAGRYKYTAELLAVFPEKTAGVQEVGRAAKVSAELKTSTERYDNGRRLLRVLIDEVTGKSSLNALIAAGSGRALATWQPPKDTPELTLNLAAAAEQVLAELHPDSAARIETFVTLATQYERQRKAGREPTQKPDQLLAAAVSGWAKGRNGATANPESAWKLWSGRELVLAYQRAATSNDRNALIGQFKRTPVLSVEEIAQMISLLPPAEPEDLNNRSGKPILIGQKDVGIYRRTTPAVPGFANGLDYLVRLPPEYHHGRAYPVLIVLTHAGLNPEDVLAPLITQADKNGYILVVPEWTNQFGGGWKWKGEDHIWVTATLRDTIRHFTVDNDRVFMIGVGDGANMAMDVGASHPDLFAGVIPMGPIPKWQGLFIECWRNAQLLPFYVVTGEISGDGIKNLRFIYEQWTRYGFPSIMSIYKGRGVEWFAAEVPQLFDWMGRKTRATPAATLKLDTRFRQSWQMIRDSDTRFYWLQATEIAPGHSGGGIVPATMIGDINNNVVTIKHRGVKQLTIWLSGDIITDWEKPIRVQINGYSAGDYPPRGKKLAPSLEVLLEDYYNRGDRRMLFLNKIEIQKIRQ